MGKINVKIFGERNTGTRLLGQLIGGNPYVLLLTPGKLARMEHKEWSEYKLAIQKYYSGSWRRSFLEALRDLDFAKTEPLLEWKHAAASWDVDFKIHDVHTIFIARNPYSWAISMARRPHHMKPPRVADFQQFVQRPWMCTERDRLGPLLPNLMALWNEKLRSYLRFHASAPEGYVDFVSFENLISEPVKTIEPLLKKMGCEDVKIKEVSNSTKNDRREAQEIRSFYETNGWRRYLNREDVRILNNLIDWQIAGAYGYEPLKPEEFPITIDKADQKKLNEDMLFGSRPVNSDSEACTTAAA